MENSSKAGSCVPHGMEWNREACKCIGRAQPDCKTGRTRITTDHRWQQFAPCGQSNYFTNDLHNDISFYSADSTFRRDPKTRFGEIFAPTPTTTIHHDIFSTHT